MYVCIQIILKHFLDKYFAPQKLNQKKKKTNYETEKQKKTQIENLMLKSEDFFGDNI